MASNATATGTLSFEDVYGVGSLDTLSDTSTQGKTKPAEGAGGEATSTRSSIFELKGNILGQPIMIWIGLIAFLLLLKYVVEKPGIKRGLGG